MRKFVIALQFRGGRAHRIVCDVTLRGFVRTQTCQASSCLAMPKSEYIVIL